MEVRIFYFGGLEVNREVLKKGRTYIEQVFLLRTLKRTKMY